MSLPCAAASKYGSSPGLSATSASFLSWYGVAIALLPFHDQCAGPVAVSDRPAGAVRQRERAVGNLDLRMRFAAELAYRFDDLRHAAAVRGVVVAEASAVGV